jgi:hypothetical protein
MQVAVFPGRNLFRLDLKGGLGSLSRRLLQGVEVTVPGARAAVSFGLAFDFRRLGSFLISRPELHGAAVVVELKDLLVVFGVLNRETLGPTLRTPGSRHYLLRADAPWRSRESGAMTI